MFALSAFFFYNKVIYCNCDTENSNFVRYFKKLKELGLIKDVVWSGGRVVLISEAKSQ